MGHYAHVTGKFEYANRHAMLEEIYQCCVLELYFNHDKFLNHIIYRNVGRANWNKIELFDE